MLRVLVVDDEKPARDRLIKLLNLSSEVEIIGEAADGLEALERVSELKPDLVFLDIDMPELNGLEVAKSLPEDGPKIIFVTAYDQYALDAFEAAAMDYVVKPVVSERLQKSIAKVKKLDRTSFDRIEKEVQRELSRMAFRIGTKFEVVEAKAISALVASDSYTEVIVGERRYFSEDSLDTLRSRLPENFLRVHRSSIINLDFLKELKRLGDRKYLAILNDSKKTEINISRERLPEIKKILKI